MLVISQSVREVVSRQRPADPGQRRAFAMVTDDEAAEFGMARRIDLAAP